MLSEIVCKKTIFASDDLAVIMNRSEHFTDNDLPSDVPTIELAGVEGSDGLQDLRVLDMGNLKQEPLDTEPKKEEEVDPNKRKLPPRRRGAR